MSERVFIQEKNTAIFLCPKCASFKTIDVSAYSDIEGDVEIDIECKCGHSFSAFLDRRKDYRKKVNLPGTYTYTSSEGEIERGTLFVKDISRNGFKFKVKVDPKFSVGDNISLKFQLDNKQKTLIKKEVVIKNIFKDKTISSEFCSVSPSDPNDKAIGFYLFR
jgi:hypothetical protein